jgi:hypothetical protein
LRDLEDLADLGVAQDFLAQFGGQQALGGLLEVVGDVVDDLVVRISTPFCSASDRALPELG